MKIFISPTSKTFKEEEQNKYKRGKTFFLFICSFYRYLYTLHMSGCKKISSKEKKAPTTPTMATSNEKKLFTCKHCAWIPLRFLAQGEGVRCIFTAIFLFYMMCSFLLYLFSGRITFCSMRSFNKINHKT